MKKIIIICCLSYCINNYAQSTDSLFYSLVNFSADHLYDKTHKEFKERYEHETFGNFIDTVFYTYLDANIKTDGRDIEPPLGHYMGFIEFEILPLESKEINDFKIYDGKAQEIDTTRWGSIATQVKQPLIPNLDCCRINDKFNCTDQFDKVLKNANTINLITSLDKKETKYSKDKRYAEHNPQKYGLQIGYPVLFEFKDCIYGFIAVKFDNLVEETSHSAQLCYYMTKWNGKEWIILSKHAKHTYKM